MTGIRSGITRRLQVVDELKGSPSEEMKGFFYAGLMMRGWSGQGPYPLKSIETSGRVDDIALIDRLISLLSSPKPWLELPLFNYVVVPKPFLPEPDPLPDELLVPAQKSIQPSLHH
jgi:hypothetical protein